MIFGLTGVAARGLLGLLADQHGGGVELPIGFAVHRAARERPPGRAADRRRRRVRDRSSPTTLPSTADGFRMVQFVWPDRNGEFPWDADYDERLRTAQPIIGTW